jgi:transcription-repair coupling factor (superfamily II helicase)
VRLQRMYPGSKYHAAASAAIIPLPTGVTDGQLIEWTKDLLVSIFGGRDTAAELAEIAAAAAAAVAVAEASTEADPDTA